VQPGFQSVQKKGSRFHLLKNVCKLLEQFKAAGGKPFPSLDLFYTYTGGIINGSKL
jgi:hypothetical protein